jgi:hypothetical protein
MLLKVAGHSLVGSGCTFFDAAGGTLQFLRERRQAFHCICTPHRRRRRQGRAEMGGGCAISWPAHYWAPAPAPAAGAWPATARGGSRGGSSSRLRTRVRRRIG